MMHEQAFRFGRARHLVGIAGLPGLVAHDAHAHDVGVIMLNAGLVHRIGPFRLNVETSRRLNASGYPTLRFDLSTIGDSTGSGESLSRKQQICADVDDAMSLLTQQSGCKRFVVMGLCSGAHNAHTVACQNPKVVGTIYLDGYAYRTFGYRVRRYAPKLLDPALWRRFVRRTPKQAHAPSMAEPIFSVTPAPQAEVRADLAGLLERGLKLCFIYTGGLSNFFNHPRQFRECFGRLVESPAVTTRFLKEIDHTYILTGDRQPRGPRLRPLFRRALG